uniref:MBF2 domain containing secreted protein n=1 Tax=Sergentomyia schwetzi TaxID=114605 RepID=A0A6B9VMD1_9DIPT|nr:MBF2 domain containing secreted protein [Sergentomyia schwetzi]
MKYLVVCFSFVLICSASAVPSGKSENGDSAGVSAKIQLVEKVEDFIRANPGVTLTKLDVLRTRSAIYYSLGQRVIGDRVVGVARESASWSTPQNVQLVLNYPANGGYGDIVSYVSILVDQSSNLGSGFIINGGIGQRHITILIEAQNTFYFNYIAEIYAL